MLCGDPAQFATLLESDRWLYSGFFCDSCVIRYVCGGKATSVAPAALQPAMIDAGESAGTARPPGSALAETALLAGGKRPFRHARQRPRR